MTDRVFRDPAEKETECWRAMLNGQVLPIEWNSKGAALAGLAAEKRRKAGRIVLIDEYGLVTSRTTLDTFLTHNEFSAEEIVAMRKAIASGKQYRGGGGASPEWTIQPDRRRVG